MPSRWQPTRLCINRLTAVRSIEHEEWIQL